MNGTTSLFEAEQAGDTLIVFPTGNLRELDSLAIAEEGSELLERLSASSAKHVVIDFRRMDYGGSTALGFFVRLAHAVRERGGRMAFCNISEHEREILETTNLDRLGPLCASRQDALRAVRG
jgi:anti-anti-sigma factor